MNLAAGKGPVGALVALVLALLSGPGSAPSHRARPETTGDVRSPTHVPFAVGIRAIRFDRIAIAFLDRCLKQGDGDLRAMTRTGNVPDLASLQADP
jgi:hypothetical protein